MSRISQNNVSILLDLDPLEDYKMIRYVYDGYTFKLGYTPIRKSKTRKKVQIDLHYSNYSKLKAQELVNKLVILDKLKNSKSYQEFEHTMKAMLGDIKYSYSIVHDLGFKVRQCNNLDEFRRNTYRYLTENY